MENVAEFTPPAIGYYGKRRIFHALDHLNTINDNKTAQQQRRACRFPRAGAIGYYGKRRIFHALDHLNIIKDNKTAQQQRRACRFPRAGSVFSATKTNFYRISHSQITHLKTRIKTSAPYLAGDSLLFSILLGKKQLPPPVHKASRLAGWRVGWVCGFGWLVRVKTFGFDRITYTNISVDIHGKKIRCSYIWMCA